MANPLLISSDNSVDFRIVQYVPAVCYFYRRFFVIDVSPHENLHLCNKTSDGMKPIINSEVRTIPSKHFYDKHFQFRRTMVKASAKASYSRRKSRRQAAIWRLEYDVSPSNYFVLLGGKQMPISSKILTSAAAAVITLSVSAPAPSVAQSFFPSSGNTRAAAYQTNPYGYGAINPYRGYIGNRGVGSAYRRLSPTVRSTLTGTAIGAGAGLVTGMIAGRGRALKGTLIGAGVGAATGFGLGLLKSRGRRMW